MNVKTQCIVTAIFILMVCVGSSQAATRTWLTTAGTNDWFVGTNWAGGVPGTTDDAVITNAGTYSVMLTGSVTIANFTLGGGSGTRSLVFSNWNTTLTTTNVTVQTNGNITCVGAFTNNAMSNRVSIACSNNLTIQAGGSINVDYVGFAGGPNIAGYGPGAGGRAGVAASGGGYGGNGGDGGGNSPTGGCPYGVFNAPMDPGSGGGGGGGSVGGHGGGAIRIIASGTVTVNGSITANGGSCASYGAGGSGGAIYITCNKLIGTNGILRADGGNFGSGYDSGGGGGGRIAVIYDQAAQSNVPVPSVMFSAARGLGIYPMYHGDIGTLYFPDSRFLTENITHIGQWMAPGLTNWSANNLTLSNGWIRFPTDGFQLTVTNNMAIIGSSGRLELGKMLWTNFIQRSFQYSVTTNSPVLQVGGNLTLTNGGCLCVYSGMTNASTPDYGALVSVTNDVFIASTTCWIYAYSHWTNGGSALFHMRNLFIVTNAGFNADAQGFAGGTNNDTCFGPGRGTNRYAGAGYGGRGGDGAGGSSGGLTYGYSNAPVAPGSAGGGSYQGQGGNGGGLIRINARGTLTLNGTITANGGNYSSVSGGGGSGGGIYIATRLFLGTNGILRAYGGNGVATSSGGGGGGRIAVWRVCDKTGGTIQTYVNFGTGWSNGVAGTVVWVWIPPTRTIIRLY